MSGEKWWDYYIEHSSDILDCVRKYSGNAEALSLVIAYLEDDRSTATRIMITAWLNAPDERSVYEVPGFREMCNLLDGTVPYDDE